MSWFVTWDRSKYKEWAKRVGNNYILLIIRKESRNKYLCVKAKLVFKSTGLPQFVTIEEKYFEDKNQAKKIIKYWKSENLH